MSNTSFAAAVVAALLWSSGVLAADWQPVSRSRSARFYADLSSIKSTGSIRRAWTKAEYTPHTERADSDPRFWAYDLTLYSFNCAEEAYRTESLTIYYEDSSNKTVGGFPNSWKPAPP